MMLARVLYRDKTTERVLGTAIYVKNPSFDEHYTNDVWMESADGEWRGVGNHAGPLFDYLTDGHPHQRDYITEYYNPDGSFERRLGDV